MAFSDWLVEAIFFLPNRDEADTAVEVPAFILPGNIHKISSKKYAERLARDMLHRLLGFRDSGVTVGITELEPSIRLGQLREVIRAEIDDLRDKSRGELAGRIEGLLEALALAHGGHSQYGTADVAKAIVGNIRNQGWASSPGDLEHLAHEAASWLAELWGEDDVARLECQREAILSEIRALLAGKPRKFWRVRASATDHKLGETYSLPVFYLPAEDEREVAFHEEARARQILHADDDHHAIVVDIREARPDEIGGDQ